MLLGSIVGPSPARDCGCSTSAKRRNVLTAAIAATAGLLMAGSSAKAQSFTDFTAASNVGTLLAAQYAADPTTWLSDESMVDLNHDGNLDLFLGVHGAGQALALINNGSGVFHLATGTFPNSEIHLAGDINGDGETDINVTDQDGGARWYINNTVAGSSVLNFVSTNDAAAGNMGRENALLDVTGDGNVDWLHSAAPGILVDTGNGKGVFTNNAGLSITVPGQVQTGAAIIPIDYNNDGAIDIAAKFGEYNQEMGRTRVYQNNGHNVFTEVQNLGLPADLYSNNTGVTSPGGVVAGYGDFNHDGYMDLMVLDDLKPEVWLNNGNGTYTQKMNAITVPAGATMNLPSTYASWGLATATDFDNDGKEDVIWNGKNFLWVLKGNGDGTFTYEDKAWGITDVSSAAVDEGICFGDINHDGRIDIVGDTNSSSQSGLKVYLNNAGITGSNHYINVRPVGLAGNVNAIGTKIYLRNPTTGALMWYDQIEDYGQQSAQNYYSYDQTERHYGLGALTDVNIEIDFPNGVDRTYLDVAADQTFVANEAAVPEPAAFALLSTAGLFLMRRRRA